MTALEVEFTLALNNRTGRFFLCRDVIRDIEDSIGEVRYWRVPCSDLPRGYFARVLGRLAHWEVQARTSFEVVNRMFPRMRRAAPVLFTDALQVTLYELEAKDIVLVHDMGPITHPTLYGEKVSEIYRGVFDEVARVAPTVVFISASSRCEYERLYGKAYRVSRVIYPGLRFELSQGESEPIPDICTPFLLSVGSIGARKNHVRALDAFERSGLVERGYSFVLCGGREVGFEEVRCRAEGLEWARMTGYVSDSQLRWLYSQAAGFVLPSLLEGFGIPAAEAAMRGLVPLVSKGGALHEVTGDSAVLVDATDVDSIAAGMIELVSLSPVQKSARLASIRQHLSFFTTEQARHGWKAVISAQRHEEAVA